MATTAMVTGMALAQKTHWRLSIFRMSAVFIPNTEKTKESGRNITVTAVKTSIAAS